METFEPAATRHRQLGNDRAALRQSLIDRLTFTIGKDFLTATERDWFHALAFVVRDRLVARWMETMRSYYREDSKRIYYLSLEFLMGRTLRNSLSNLGILDATREAVEELGLDFDIVAHVEPDAALGNGGLGRLAACYLDSMATLGLPAYGYGIRYEYGMFYQRIEGGYQVEHPENWLRYGNPWEFPRPEVLYPVKFGGRLVEYRDEDGRFGHHWVDTDEVMAMAYDMTVPGYHTETVNNMRLWSAKASRDFDLRYFNEGNYIEAVAQKNESENLSRVLYPDDTTTMGRELRLKQQYFFVSASLQDILFRFQKSHDTWDRLPDKVAIQLNDTHPALAIPELMRILVDQHKLDWDHAWDITRRTFAYTNHTLMPEALETWPVATFETTLPRHLQLIYEINQRLITQIRHQYPGDEALVRRISLIDETEPRRIRMATLATVGSHTVNGVAKLHTQLMCDTIFADLHNCGTARIINITNGITPRRWLRLANPGLTRLISAHIGEGWTTDLEALQALRPLADDAGFRAAFAEVKRANKERLAGLVEQHLRIKVTPDSLYDVHIKRIHEYKRQLLNALHVVTLYNRIRNGARPVPRTVIFSGKAAPGYNIAKLIIKLITDVADVVNEDRAIGDLLNVVFIPNYDVSTAMDIIPAAELSQQISTAGTEASGTGNMKLALNGALTIGTLDGANIEILDEVGAENMFIFGLGAEQVDELRTRGYEPRQCYEQDGELRQALDMIASGYFSPDQPLRYQPLVTRLLDGGDPYYVLADFAAYRTCQEAVEKVYRDPDRWIRMAVCNVAGMGRFSSDRAVREYADKIWKVEPVPQRRRARQEASQGPATSEMGEIR